MEERPTRISAEEAAAAARSLGITAAARSFDFITDEQIADAVRFIESRDNDIVRARADSACGKR